MAANTTPEGPGPESFDPARIAREGGDPWAPTDADVAAAARAERDRLAARTPEQVAADAARDERCARNAAREASFDNLASSNLDAWLAAQRGSQALEAMQLRLLAAQFALALDRAGSNSVNQDTEIRSVAAELAAASNQSDVTMRTRLQDAYMLVAQWPATVDAFEAGTITRTHVRVIEREGQALIDAGANVEVRAEVEAALLAEAAGTTPGRLRRIAKRLVNARIEEPLTVRHQRARDARCVRVYDGDDGMATIWATIPAVLAHGIHDRLSRAAKQKSLDDPRTMDQHRADSFCALLLTGETGQDAWATINAEIVVTIPATLLSNEGDDPDSPAVLDGRTLIDANTARALAAGTPEWQRLFLDPVTQRPIATDTYRPSRRLRRLIRHSHQQTCAWHGCTQPAHRCDIDHTHDWHHGGRTCLGNLAPLCRTHHTLKHASRWHLEQPRPGVMVLTSPLGHTYTDEPPPPRGPTFRGPTFDEAAA